MIVFAIEPKCTVSNAMLFFSHQCPNKGRHGAHSYQCSNHFSQPFAGEKVMKKRLQVIPAKQNERNNDNRIGQNEFDITLCNNFPFTFTLYG